MFNKHLVKENEALREELHILKQVREGLREEMIFLNLNERGEIKAVNEVFEKELGYSLSQVKGHRFFEFVPEIARSTPHFKKLKDSIEQRVHYWGAIEFLRENGEEAWLRGIVEPIFDGKGNIHKFSVNLNDLTRTIANSKEHEDLVAALHKSNAVIEFDLNGNIQDANEAFLKAVKYRLNDIKGQHHRIFCDTEYANSREYKTFWERLTQGEFVAGRFERLDAHGNTIWLEATYNPICDSHGRMYKVVKLATESRWHEKMPCPVPLISPTVLQTQRIKSPREERKSLANCFLKCLRCRSKWIGQKKELTRWTLSLNKLPRLSEVSVLLPNKPTCLL